MLNLDTNQEIRTISLRDKMPFYIIVTNKNILCKYSIVMTSITEKEEKLIDAQQEITIERGGVKFNISSKNVYCYGTIDYTDYSDDLDVIADFSWLNHLSFRGVVIPANYDYNTHTCKSILNIPKQYDTFKPDVVAQFGHGCLGKPEKTAIFKHIWRKPCLI